MVKVTAYTVVRMKWYLLVWNSRGRQVTQLLCIICFNRYYWMYKWRAYAENAIIAIATVAVTASMLKLWLCDWEQREERGQKLHEGRVKITHHRTHSGFHLIYFCSLITVQFHEHDGIIMRPKSKKTEQADQSRLGEKRLQKRGETDRLQPIIQQ